MTMQRRAPVRPKLPAVCRALIDPAAHQSKGNRATFDEWLRDIARGEDVRLSDTMLRGRYLTFPWWFMRECKYPALAQSRDEPSSKLRRRREDAINAYAPEALEKLAARGLWPLDWLSGASPLRFVRRGSTRELEQPASFAEVFNYASMLPTLIAAFSACAEVLQRARVRCRGQTVAPYRALSSGGIVGAENAPPANWGDVQTAAATAAYEHASTFGFRLTLADASTGDALSDSGWSASAVLRFDVPVIWCDGEIGEEMRFARWLEESGSVDSPNIRLVAA